MCSACVHLCLELAGVWQQCAPRERESLDNAVMRMHNCRQSIAQCKRISIVIVYCLSEILKAVHSDTVQTFELLLPRLQSTVYSMVLWLCDSCWKVVLSGRFQRSKFATNQPSTGEDWCFWILKQYAFVSGKQGGVDSTIFYLSWPSPSLLFMSLHAEVGCKPAFLLSGRCEASLENDGPVQDEPLPLAPNRRSRLALSGGQVSQSHSFGSL